MDERPTTLLDGMVGTGHYAHPRRNPRATRPSPDDQAFCRSWAVPRRDVTPNLRDAPT
jgi:hypothetical protein